MIFHVLTIFPEFFAGPFAHGVVKRAQDAGILEIRIQSYYDLPCRYGEAGKDRRMLPIISHQLHDFYL